MQGALQLTLVRDTVFVGRNYRKRLASTSRTGNDRAATLVQAIGLWACTPDVKIRSEN